MMCGVISCVSPALWLARLGSLGYWRLGWLYVRWGYSSGSYGWALAVHMWSTLENQCVSWRSFISFRLNATTKTHISIVRINYSEAAQGSSGTQLIKKLIKDTYLPEKVITVSRFSLAWYTYCNYLKLYRLCLASIGCHYLDKQWFECMVPCPSEQTAVYSCSTCHRNTIRPQSWLLWKRCVCVEWVCLI